MGDGVMVSKFSACCGPTEDRLPGISEGDVPTDRIPKLERNNQVVR